MNCIERYVARFPTQTEAGRRISVTRQEIWAWRKRGLIPFSHASKVEIVTEGEVTRFQILEEHELRMKLRVNPRKGRRGRRKGS